MLSSQRWCTATYLLYPVDRGVASQTFRWISTQWENNGDGENTDSIYASIRTLFNAGTLRQWFARCGVASLQASFWCTNFHWYYVERPIDCLTVAGSFDRGAGPNSVNKDFSPVVWRSSHNWLSRNHSVWRIDNWLRLKASWLHLYASVTYEYAPGLGHSKISPLT